MTDVYRLALVGCGAAKRDEPAPARDLYTSTYFAKKRAYAEECCDAWFVLSAEHQILHPDREIGPYETTMADVADVEAWADGVMGGLFDAVDFAVARHRCQDLEIVILAGRDYVDPLRDRLAAQPWTVRYPFDATSGIGEQMAWLSERVEAQG